MKFIEFHKEKCDNCYKCLRACPTKAISFNGEQRAIIDDLCIKCGLCQAVCKSEALNIRNLVSKVMNWIDSDYNVAVSLAPSYVGAFGLKEPGRMASALYRLGFDIVEETAVGAEVVARAYDQFIEAGNEDVIITSCCPSANYLIEQHYPMAIDSIIPVVSPMIAHGKGLKKVHGSKVKVVFIGPCLAKMAEAEEMSDAVDAVLTFDELNILLKSKGILVNECEPDTFNQHSTSRGRAFPLGSSLNTRGNRSRKDGQYRFLHVSGFDACSEVMKELRMGNLKNCCIEMNICEGSCINGPDMPKNHLSRFSRELHMRTYAQTCIGRDNQEMISNEQVSEVYKDISLERAFKDRHPRRIEPNVNSIQQMMQKMGKFSEQDELDCGACGYKTCYDKAKAAYLGYSDIETCLPHLREKAESMQSVMIEHSPNAVLIIDNEMLIREVNPTFIKLFNEEGLPMIDMPIDLFIDSRIFSEVFEKKVSVLNRKAYNDEIDCYFIINAVYIEGADYVIAFMTDISEDERRRIEFLNVKKETLSKTQEVIDKQMRVAQEIASLLGETTAETKMSLKSLNQLVLSDKGGY